VHFAIDRIRVRSTSTLKGTRCRELVMKGGVVDAAK
jgi:hypothetical protein